MNRRALKQAVRARRAELRARLAEARAGQRRRKSLRRRLIVLALLLLLYLLLRNCECDTPIVAPGAPDATATHPGPAVVADAALAPPVEAPRRAKRRRPIRIAPTPRGELSTGTPTVPAWLAALQLQVAARGPRLATCFEGVDQPGALTWSAVVDRARGLVADQRFEPTLAGADLPPTRRACLATVLRDPPYRLPAGADDPEAGARITMVIEF